MSRSEHFHQSSEETIGEIFKRTIDGTQDGEVGVIFAITGDEPGSYSVTFAVPQIGMAMTLDPDEAADLGARFVNLATIAANARSSEELAMMIRLYERETGGAR